MHLVIGAVVFVVWFGVLGFVLTHGRNEASSVDVYSELPPGFNDALAAKGVTYQGLSPVDANTRARCSRTCRRRRATTAGSPGLPHVVRRDDGREGRHDDAGR